MISFWYFCFFIFFIWQFSETRVKDAHAIVDLSMYNYQEMRHLVTKRSFYWRKKIDNFLYRIIPQWWIPLYTMVTFTRTPYKQCLELRQRQDNILKAIRFVGYSIFGSLIFKQFAVYVLRPLIMKFIARKVLPEVVAEKVA